MYIANTMFKKPDKRYWTWESPDGKKYDRFRNVQPEKYTDRLLSNYKGKYWKRSQNGKNKDNSK